MLRMYACLQVSHINSQFADLRRPYLSLQLRLTDKHFEMSREAWAWINNVSNSIEFVRPFFQQAATNRIYIGKPVCFLSWLTFYWISFDVLITIRNVFLPQPVITARRWRRLRPNSQGTRCSDPVSTSPTSSHTLAPSSGIPRQTHTLCWRKSKCCEVGNTSSAYLNPTWCAWCTGWDTLTYLCRIV